MCGDLMRPRDTILALPDCFGAAFARDKFVLAGHSVHHKSSD